jgi:hypothetical protein
MEYMVDNLYTKGRLLTTAIFMCLINIVAIIIIEVLNTYLFADVEALPILIIDVLAYTLLISSSMYIGYLCFCK